MTSRNEASKPRAAPADHAGSELCRLLIGHPDVIDIEILGQSEIFEGTISYSLGVFLPGGRELYIDVEDAPAHPSDARPRILRTQAGSEQQQR
jgi:hypothetical protein